MSESRCISGSLEQRPATPKQTVRMQSQWRRHGGAAETSWCMETSWCSGRAVTCTLYKHVNLYTAMIRTGGIHYDWFPFIGNSFGPNDSYDCGVSCFPRSCLCVCLYPFFGLVNCTGYCFEHACGRKDYADDYRHRLHELCKWSQTTLCCFWTDCK
jgi:hypothetical protein